MCSNIITVSYDNNNEISQCFSECPSNCDACTYDYADDVDASECDDGGCSAAYINNEEGGCEGNEYISSFFRLAQI